MGKNINHLSCVTSSFNDNDMVIVSDCVNDRWDNKVIRVTKNCRYEIKCEINIPLPAFENKNVDDLLKIFSAKEIMECKENLSYEEKEKLKLILELSK